MPTTTLPVNNDFSSIDFTIPNSTAITTNPSIAIIDDANVGYQAPNSTNPTGLWVANDKQVTIGTVVIAKFYTGYLSVQSTIQTHLAAMNINTKFSNAAATFSSKLSASTDGSYSDMLTAANDCVSGLGVTAAEFIQLVVPGTSTSAEYNATSWKSMLATVDQYSNSKLTDNTVLQQKLDVANNNRSSLLDGMGGLLKTWMDFLSALARGV